MQEQFDMKQTSPDVIKLEMLQLFGLFLVFDLFQILTFSFASCYSLSHFVFIVLLRIWQHNQVYMEENVQCVYLNF